MVEITVTQYEKMNDSILDYHQAVDIANAAKWVKDSWDYELEGIVNKSLSIKSLIKKIENNKIVTIKSPYVSNIQIVWTICKQNLA